MPIDRDSQVRFHCPLNSTWPELLPGNLCLSQEQKFARSQFGLNPWLHLENKQLALWQEKARQISYVDHLPMLWVRHPIFEYPEAYWPDAEMQHLLKQLASGRLSPQDLDDPLFYVLKTAHILTLKDPETLHKQKSEAFGYWRQSWKTKGYVVLNNLISPLQTAALRTYLRAIYQHKPLMTEDDAHTRRKYLSGDFLLRFLQAHIAAIIKHIIDQIPRPTYAVISYYQETWLRPHVDRSPCIWNLSLQADTEPESSLAEPWALWLDSKTGEVPVSLNLGDAVLYPGRSMHHGRDALAPGRKETVLLFHFVNQSYQGQMW